ncbi:DMT family transporter [Jannaschia sp. 2305UL9-9]|uniref:DMT family transporter n=1 Tax=Jannaschia sp. 2305UL9-9 TaxID=3121638 RepID=UPI003526DDA9
MTDTIRGALFMTLAMAAFAVEDALIKGLSNSFVPAQIVWMLGLGGTLAFAAYLRATGQTLWTSAYLTRPIMARTGFEAIGTLFFVSALAVVPLALASAVIQATPLLVALGSVLFFGAQVRWRRWAAIAVGFAGVLVILRPTGEGFEATTLLAVCGMLGLAGRDLSTRAVPATMSGLRLSFLAFASLVPVGLLLQGVQGLPVIAPNLSQIGILGLCVAVGMIGYVIIVAATRMGDMAIVSSFRYSRMMFALIVATVFFGESPDFWTLVGVAIVIGAGVFTLLREAKVHRAASKAKRHALQGN